MTPYHRHHQKFLGFLGSNASSFVSSTIAPLPLLQTKTKMLEAGAKLKMCYWWQSTKWQSGTLLGNCSKKGELPP